jgi:hypothetical protein
MTHKLTVRLINESAHESRIQQTVDKAVRALSSRGIASTVCGGLAVQQYGYARFTSDVDLIVTDVAAAHKVLSLAGFRPSKEVPGVVSYMIDRETKIEMDVLPGGKAIGTTVIEFPMPTDVSDQPQVITLEQLLSLKLGAWQSSPVRRLRDKTDVVELIIRNELPRSLDVDPRMQQLYEQIWDEVESAPQTLEE